jgi:bacteriocin biosynthesis cyclodehydratase domain-containing protein
MLAHHGLSCEALDNPDDAEYLDPFCSVVVALASPVRPRTSLATINAACVDSGLTWLPISFEGATAYVGPLVVPGTSACLDCHAGADDVTLEYRAGTYRELEGQPPTPPAAYGAHEFGLSLATVVLARWILDHDPHLPGRQFSIALRDLTVSRAWWRRETVCATCGDIGW